MFRRHAFQVKLVKDPKHPKEITDGTVQTHDAIESVEIVAAYAEIVKSTVTHVALTVGGVWAACKIIERVCR